MRSLVAALFTIMFAQVSLADLPKVNISVLKFGTVNWELDTIKRLELDAQNGFEMEVNGVAGGAAAKVAFQAGETDVIVTDWLWVARQRAQGKDYRFIPYSKAVGSLIVKNDSPIMTLEDLKGSKVGIAGGPLDKSWLILRAYAMQEHGMDLKGDTEQVFGAPPLMMKAALTGETDAAINFWHFLAKMKAKGMRSVISVDDAALALGLDPNTPLLGYVVEGSYADKNPEIVAGLANASRSAKGVLGADDAAWEHLKGRMKPKSDAEFTALIEGFREGIPSADPIDIDAANRMLMVMADLGGSDLVGDLIELPDGLFIRP